MPPPRTSPIDRTPPEDREIGLAAIVAAILRRWLIVAGSVALFIALAVAYIALTPARYTASTSILLDPRLGKTVGADPTTPGFSPDTNAIDSQIRLLTSQTVLSRVATRLHLDQAPEFSGARFSLSSLFGGNTPSETGADLKALDQAISIKKPDRTYVVEILATAATGERAAAIANAIVEAYNEDQISSRVVATRNDAKFVTQKREQLRGQIEQADTRIEAYKRANNIVSTDGLRSNEQQVSDLTRELGTARGRLSELKARTDQINAIARSGKLDSTPDALKSPAIERLRGAQTDTERELARLAETLGAKHPALLEARAQVQRVRELIVAELGRLKQSADNDFQVERRNEAQLIGDLDRIKRQVTDTGSKLVPLRQMEREVDALRASDERFARLSDTLTQQEGDSPPARVVAGARPPVSPSWPRRSLILGLAAAVGLFFGLGAALFFDALRRPHASRRASANLGSTDLAPAPDGASYWRDEPSLTPAPVMAAGDESRRARMAEIRSRAKTRSESDDENVDAQASQPATERRRHPRRRLVWS